MSIRKKLILSNIAMVVAPFALYLFIEIIAGYIFVHRLNRQLVGDDLRWFMTVQILGLIFAIAVSNGAITYLVSRSILRPVRMLSRAAKEISHGNLAFTVSTTGKDEIGELASVFEQMRMKLLEAKQLQAKYEANRKELIASISHDLRTPMTSIKGYSRGILDGVARSPEKVEHYAHIIYSNAVMMEKMIDELFLYSKLDLNQVPMYLEALDVTRFFLEYIDESEPALKQAGIRVVFPHDADTSCMVWADRTQLRRVVDNIVQNSLKYMEKATKTIEIRVSSERNEAKVEIEDNGIGIAAASVPRIFESFFRADEARNSSTGGSGLGMAIAKHIIEAHGGRIGAASTEGRGTIIFFYLMKAAGGGGRTDA